METSERWFNNPGIRAAFLNSLLIGIVSIVGLSCYLLWPEVREYIDQKRAEAIFTKVEEFETAARLRGVSELDHGFTQLYSTEIEVKVNRLLSPTALSTLGHNCVDAIPHARKMFDDSDCRFYLWAEVCVLRRLSEVNSDASVRTFVDLYCDEHSALDGEYSECAYEYLGNCKDKALPYLRAKQQQTNGFRGEWLSRTIYWLESLEQMWP